MSSRMRFTCSSISGLVFSVPLVADALITIKSGPHSPLPGFPAGCGAGSLISHLLVLLSIVPQEH